MTRTKYAISIAGIYGVVGLAYIQLSSAFVGEAASDVGEAVVMETLKGFGFIIVSAVGLFVLSRHLIGRAIEASAEAVAVREAFVRAQERATSGIFAASLAHDLKNLLLIIRFGIEELESSEGEPNPTTAEDVREALARASELTDRLARAGEPMELTADEVDVTKVVVGALNLLRSHRKASSVDFRVVTKPVTGRVYVSLVRQAITNLVLNAMEAAPDPGVVLVRVEAAGTMIHIEVHDNGEGVANADHVFEEFWTTKEHGTGLGLASVNICASAHRGAVSIHRSDELGGAMFRLELGSPSGEPLGLA